MHAYFSNLFYLFIFVVYYLYDKPSALFYHLNPVLERIIAQKEAEDFLYPVDAVALGVPVSMFLVYRYVLVLFYVN